MANFTVTPGPALSPAGKMSFACGASAYTCVAWGLNSNVIANGIVANVSVTLSGSGAAPIAVANSLGASPAGNVLAGAVPEAPFPLLP